MHMRLVLSFVGSPWSANPDDVSGMKKITFC